MIKKYRFCFFGMFIFALLSVYTPTGVGSALSVLFSILAFLFFAIFLYYFIRVKLIVLSLIIKDIRNKMR
ncbi:Uncharacterised protein [Streptococcus pneumoniae]|uniref:Uncharacterized protein n=1 Tax=Streptococcus pneumoniae TaxID=1313 RepID=A0A4M9XNU7_STREE|nr:hypothetical protein NTPn38_09920 [Streptococcus pneumoniae]PLV91886.1 hypothetical protein AZJ12_04280 [Streptococcus pneumoniae]TVV56357.1 hypothetical protein AZK35_01960 [Streptococcus pneumoniae]TVV91438.1 hypothetical protein AZK18_09955 [Streptococcus pneumoniae]TVW02768.1 hypothetical protein AZK16_11195 [Streptococcus pneumoniae]